MDGVRLGAQLSAAHTGEGEGCRATVEQILKKPDGWVLVIEIARELGRYVIRKGSICLDGVSLTVNEIADRERTTMLSLTLIPTTVSLTSFKALREGQRLNLEVDAIGKFVERLTAPRI